MTRTALLAILALTLPAATLATDADAGDPATGVPAAPKAAAVSGIEFSAEVFTGYLTGVAGEYVYNVPGDRSKLSQLDWQIDDAAVLGGRVTWRARDWLSLRLGGWSVVASDNAMDDFDWLEGYSGFDSWSDWSHSEVTDMVKAYQVDVGGAAHLHQFGPLSLSALAGYRFMTFKMASYGGHYIYSGFGGFRNFVGKFPEGELGISYQQWWHTPYVGLAMDYTSGPLKITGETIGSPLVIARDKDSHHLRDIVFREKFTRDWMVGFSLGVEYVVSERVALTARAEYQRYFLTKGGTTAVDAAAGSVARFPKPGAGADMNTLMLSLGLKAGL